MDSIPLGTRQGMTHESGFEQWVLIIKFSAGSIPAAVASRSGVLYIWSYQGSGVRMARDEWRGKVVERESVVWMVRDGWSGRNGEAIGE